MTGRITSAAQGAVDYATVYLKDTSHGCTTNEKGRYHLTVPAGDYVLVVSAFGFRKEERPIRVDSHGSTRMDVVLTPIQHKLDEVVVTGSGVSQVNRSAFNAVAVDAKKFHNSTQELSGVLAKVPGLKLRESGGVGSEQSLMLDGFSGKHIKLFIDGVPQEGVGESFGLHNIPINFAERVEVYKGVVPVGFGTDALGGVVNIVTGRRPRGWTLDASYSFGSFNTHKSYADFSYVSDAGLFFEINAFQNYSDNNYWVDTPVEQFYDDGTTMLDASVTEHVRRFNDTYHNEAVIGKVGVVNRPWADRFVGTFTYSHLYKEIQTGVVQKVVFGQKHRHGYSLMPSVEYSKRNLFTQGLSLSLTAGYNRNVTENVDTSAYRYNWRGQSLYQNGTLGEQSYQDRRSDNDNWNATLTMRYAWGAHHGFVLNHVFTSFHRANSPSAGTVASEADDFTKLTRKHVTGLSYQFVPSERGNVSVFGKYYHQFNSGPVSTSASGTSDYRLLTHTTRSWGYGAAGTCFLLRGTQVKLSYERAYRLPTTDELFGDEDLELGAMGLLPERSDNVNLNLCYDRAWGRHGLYAEGGLVYRNTADYIQRRIGTYTGNKSYASYQNHGKVRTKGYTVSLRYTFGEWVSVGGNLSHLDVRDNVKTLNEGSEQPNLSYKARMPNLPYLFAQSDVTFCWRDCIRKGNTLSVTYDNAYQHAFPLYSENLGSKDSKMLVPDQFSHNLGLTYSLGQGRYNLSVECRNLTDAKLYDNFSLQKAGRAFYGKVRVVLGRRSASVDKGHSRRRGGRRGHGGTPVVSTPEEMN